MEPTTVLEDVRAPFADSPEEDRQIRIAAALTAIAFAVFGVWAVAWLKARRKKPAVASASPVDETPAEPDS